MARGYNPKEYYDSDEQLRQAIDQIRVGIFSQGDTSLFKPLVDALLQRDDYLVLAELLLDDPDKWNRGKILELLDTQKTQRVDLPKPKPIMLLYMTVWFDENNSFIFKKDAYDRDKPVLEGLNEEFSIWQRRVLDQ
jgi:hypothetical protein